MNSKKLALINFLHISFLLTFVALSASAQPQVNMAPQWQEVELVFEAEQDYENPYTDVEMFVEFSGPNGREIRRPAFWDGDNTWRVRFASPLDSGQWSWKSISSVTNDAGLHDVSGTIQSYPPDQLHLE